MDAQGQWESFIIYVLFRGNSTKKLLPRTLLKIPRKRMGQQALSNVTETSYNFTKKGLQQTFL